MCDRTPARIPLLSRPFAPATASALLAIALFAVSLGGTYIYDDFDVFQLDNRLRHPDQWWRYWTESYNGGVDNLYRPLVSMTYAVPWWLHGADQTIDQSDAWKYHLVNVLLHAAVSALVAEFARRLAGLRVAWVSGLLFAVHPIHVEPVANIVGRAELMCALGVVGALVLFMKPLTVPRALAITGCFILAVGSKEQGMLTPLLILLLALTQTPSPGTPGERKRDRNATLLLIILLTWSLSGYIVFRESILKFWWDRSFLDWTINPLARADADRWTMPLVLLGQYATLLVAPLRLSPDYGATVIGWNVSAADPYLWLGIATILLWTFGIITAIRRRDGGAIFCLVALALTYGLISNFVLLIGVNLAERLMYLPSVFFLLLVAMALSRLPRAAMVAIISILVILGAWRSFTYALRWNDRLSFYQISLREQPRAIRLYLLLIVEQMNRGNLDEAERLAVEASRQLPEYWGVWEALGNVAILQQRFDDADRYFMRAMEIPGNPSVRIARWMTRVQQLRDASTRPSTAPAPSQHD